MAGLLEGRVAIVTGAGRGIGRAEALALAAEGCRVVVNDLGVSMAGEGADASPAEQVVAEIKQLGGEAVPNFGNVASMEDGEAMVRQALDTFGRLDIVVNNAGIVRLRMVYNMTEQDWDATMAVHLKGSFTVTRPASIIFKQQRSGRIVNTSSPAGLGAPGHANYSAAKEGIVGLTRTLAKDLGRYGVTANAIRPVAGTRLTQGEDIVRGAIERARREGEAAGPTADEVHARFAALGAERVGAFVAFLCSDAAANVNGRDFAVQGGTISLMSLPAPVHTISRPEGWTAAALAEVFPATIGQSLARGMRDEE